MTSNSCIIIHQSPIVQNGLNSIMQSLSMEVREILLSCPDCKVLKEWRGFIILVDTKHWNFIQKHRKYLIKGNNSIIGLDFTDQPTSDFTPFHEVILKTDSQSSVISKLNKFIDNPKEKGSSNQLSTRERDVLKLVALGNSNKQIAEKLFISIHTAITHRKNITHKLGVKSISGLTLYASINNMID